MEQGLIHIYTGDGKGKTTAAMGLALRAAGRNLRVIIIQFMKSDESGEVLFINRNIPGIEIHRFNSQKKFPWRMNETETELLREETLKGFDYARQITSAGECDILILDELLGAAGRGFIETGDIKKFLAGKPSTIEIVLTGRNASPELIEIADLVTEMKKVKHPLDRGIKARTGIER